MPKVLVLRFSSIGDIVLTTPVLRSLKQARPEVELHYLTKAAFVPLLAHNPYVDQVHALEKPLGPQLKQLRAEKFDHILDLHHNLRSLRIKWALRVPSSSFDKQNWAKYRMVRFKTRLALPHIVARYGETLRPLGVALDEGGLELHLPPGAEAEALTRLEAAAFPAGQALAVVLGATYPTKRWLPAYFVETLNALGRPVLLLGGPDARAEADELIPQLTVPYFDAVGNYPLLEAAALMKACPQVLAHDTGFMHIAAAFGQEVISLWGNTVPEFGMTPYRTPHQLLEVKDLGCRPCSKIGFAACPKGHFRCMRELKPEAVVSALRGEEGRNWG